ncbi:hypothetical protein NVP1271B_08 [Vibrio phage 1.271.B._10N.286.54.B4]|nr:hypothetical protein NVP1027O_08 [Vibrio phage 1.027.O._10N.286.54.B8]AUR92335.1 hypothetical protein NVP1171O_08 [Vibrio phage 1.171.O._10N.261.52.F12]AUR94388.1 hypothetical protein NVP1194O_08 [Vibrio phage 1.194.O._10N.286.54.B1]AUR94473.1 hypothetical protein NVP1195O_08 [Vibrio phage 1.195.O._10N.286.54.C8]AUR94561.1 hypothetical protein NVP1196O_08 [Vibrio phage 1.196.O._10N.286.54.E12]AUR95028.1 hypothetical protein NVP1200O_08 [Vibrio phage 1.200.O._10N.286.55.E1]AUR99516.1 hypoth
MTRATLSELLNRVDQDIQENTSGNITATTMNELLDYLTNNLYLPTDSTVTVNATTGIKEFTFGNGLTVTVDGAAGTAAISVTDNTPVIVFGEMNITTNESNIVTFGAGQTTADDTLLPITPGTTYFEVPGYSGGIQDGLVYDAGNGGLRATVAGTYHFDGWLSCRHTVNNSTVGVVFGVKRGGVIVGTSPRPTPAEMPNADDIGLISGTGLVVLEVNDVVVPLIATQNIGDVTINNSTLVGKLIKAS